jgi:Domain of unknown function (DUF222)
MCRWTGLSGSLRLGRVVAHRVNAPADGSGTAGIEGQLFATEPAVLDKPFDATARAVCEGDPRTLGERRADALGALAHGGDRLTCDCRDALCEAAEAAPVCTRVLHPHGGVGDVGALP